MFGVELFEDSRLLRVVLVQLHYDTVGCVGDPPFPLADADDRTKTNANLVLYWIRQHQADEQVFLVHLHRYFHRDSQDVSDGLDLKHSHVHTASVRDQEVDAMVLDFCRFVATDEAHYTLCAPPAVYDFSTAPIATAIDALTTLPWVHTRVAAPPPSGVQ